MLARTTDYSSVTETWGLPAPPEQLAMLYNRYRLAGDLAAGKRVLEIGCGGGMGLAYLRERARLAIGGDYTLALLREARAHLPDSLLVRLDAQHLPFASAGFDVVLMLEMLYYVADPDLAFAECRRLLAPGGRLLVAVPNRDRPDFNPSPHARHYHNVPELAELFGKHGLTVDVYGGFAVETESARDRRLAPVRHLAVRYHLIPRSMRMKALIKRVLYGRLPKIGAVHEGMARYREPQKLDPSRPSAAFKNLYAIGRLAAD